MNNQLTVLRHLRQINAAVSGHGYEATYWIQYSDGSMESQRTDVIAINQTNVRAPSKGNNWEERVAGAPGWFRCDNPFDAVKETA